MRGAGLGESYSFDDTSSKRLRIGDRMSRQFKSGTVYVGGTYEYEFGGNIKTKINTIDGYTPTTRSGSVLVEGGFTLNDNTSSGPAITMGLTGWVGRKQGVEGTVQLRWCFN